MLEIATESLFWVDKIVFLLPYLAEPYSSFGRRGRKEPEALAAASLKRLFVENQPYLVSGYSQHLLAGLPSNGVVSKYSSRLHKLRSHQVDTSDSVSSMAEKYKFMRQTFKKRLAFGKHNIWLFKEVRLAMAFFIGSSNTRSILLY